MNELQRGRSRPDYGVDGYPYVVGLSALAVLLGVASAVFAARGDHVLAVAVAVAAVLPAVPAVLGLRYVLHGKMQHRDRLLDRIAWRGDEQVLDVGTGGGILLIGVAKRAPRGRAFGIDIWSSTDLSGNTKARVLRNAALEDVAERVEVRDDDARTLSFEAATFDVVVSMLCLHNIEDGRDQALAEIARVLRPGGTAVISDLAGTAEAATVLTRLGLQVNHGGMEWGTFPFQRVLVAKKPG